MHRVGKGYFERGTQRRSGGEVGRAPDFFLSLLLFPVKPCFHGNLLLETGRQQWREGYPPSLKEDGQPVCAWGRVVVCVCASVFLYLCWKLQYDGDLHHCTWLLGLYQVKQGKCGLSWPSGRSPYGANGLKSVTPRVLPTCSTNFKFLKYLDNIKSLILILPIEALICTTIYGALCFTRIPITFLQCVDFMVWFVKWTIGEKTARGKEERKAR